MVNRVNWLIVAALALGTVACGSSGGSERFKGNVAKENKSGSGGGASKEQTAADGSKTNGPAGKTDDSDDQPTGLSEPAMVSGAFLACSWIELPGVSNNVYYGCGHNPKEKVADRRKLEWEIVDGSGGVIKGAFSKISDKVDFLDSIISIPAHMRTVATVKVRNRGSTDFLGKFEVSTSVKKIFVPGISDAPGSEAGGSAQYTREAIAKVASSVSEEDIMSFFTILFDKLGSKK